MLIEHNLESICHCLHLYKDNLCCASDDNVRLQIVLSEERVCVVLLTNKARCSAIEAHHLVKDKFWL